MIGVLLKSCWCNHVLVPTSVLCWIVRFRLEETEETKSRRNGGDEEEVQTKWQKAVQKADMANGWMC